MMYTLIIVWVTATSEGQHHETVNRCPTPQQVMQYAAYRGWSVRKWQCLRGIEA